MAIKNQMMVPVNGTYQVFHPETETAMIVDWDEKMQTFQESEALKKTMIDWFYPVGSIFQTTTANDPNRLWPGTRWVKMDAGRVLISAGTYTENGKTYTYKLGDKGGEAKHQLTTEELPAHSHPLSISAVGPHTHRMLFSDRDSGYGDMRAGGENNHRLTKITESAGEHTHTGTAASVGNGHFFNIMQPYEAITRWKRIV